MQIGKYNVGILEDIKNLYIYDFGIFIEMAPDEEQKAQLEQNIQMALSKGGIDLEDAIDIRTLTTLRWLTSLLKVKRKSNAEREEKQSNRAMQAQQAMQQHRLTGSNASSRMQDAASRNCKLQAEIQAELRRSKERLT